MKRLVIDTSNILFRVAAANNRYNSGSAEDMAGLAMHTALNTLKSHYRKIKPDQIAVAFEGTNNWRKKFTASSECVSKRQYKANRVKDDSMIPFYELISAFEKLAREHTSLVCLSDPLLEGDDLIAGFAQRFSAAGDEVVILSGDKDFMQLLNLPGVTLINPDDGMPRECENAEYFMFEKAVRGDSGDNVMAAFPRVRSTKIKEAFNDPYARANFMNHVWEFADPSTGEKRPLRVGDLFEENIKLMDLSKQPDEIRARIEETLDRELAKTGTFSLFHFQKFCGKFGLKKISEDAAHFIDLFSSATYRATLQEEPTRKAQQVKKKVSTLVF
jgi:hypothetical protein